MSTERKYMRKTLNVGLSESIYKKVKAESCKRKQSMSSYISSAIADYDPNINSVYETDLEVEYDQLTIRLQGEAASLLRKRANQQGLTPTAYVRDIALHHDLNLIEVEHSIGKHLLMAFNDYDMDIKYLINCFEKASSKEDFELIRHSVESNTIALAKLVVKYQKRITKDLALLEKRIRKEKSNGN